MTDVHITRKEHGRHGRYVATVAGIEAEAKLVFTHRGPGLISADHTLSPESLKGTGAASALVDRLVSDARGQGFRIIPFCPYVRARYLKNPAWQDVMTVVHGVVPEPCAD
ncbi:GNAT family N-acetyltransferase [Rhodanobacter caeni]|uniref:N-acetyltransferase domain-containing protein n=1 Tax=Rhodanobacter caeni TaxID=657654 RepID=A0ABN0UB33_9GAMM